MFLLGIKNRNEKFLKPLTETYCFRYDAYIET